MIATIVRGARSAVMQVLLGASLLALSLHLNANADLSIVAWWGSLAVIASGLWRLWRRRLPWLAVALPIAALPVSFLLTNALVEVVG